MSKAIQELKKLEAFTNWTSDEDIDNDLYNLWGNVACRTIKKELVALKIIRDKVVSISWILMTSDVEQYNTVQETQCQLTEEEYNLVKEVILAD